MHSKFWLPEHYFTNFPKRGTAAASMAMSTICRGVGNFVKLVTERNIPVQFSTDGNSYTDNKTIVLAALDKIEQVDSMVGLALHEGAHIKLSQKLFQVNSLVNAVTTHNGSLSPSSSNINITTRESFADSSFFRYVLRDIAEAVERRNLKTRMFTTSGGTNRVDYYRIWSDVHLMLNFLEDRRIDSWMYQNIGGFRPYYDSLYDRYFFTDEMKNYMETKVQIVKSPMGEEARSLTEPTFQNYAFWIIGMMHPAFDSTALPGLDEIEKICDIHNIERLDKTMEQGEFNYKYWVKGIGRDDSYGVNGDKKRMDQELPDIYHDAFKVVKLIYENVEEKSDPSMDSCSIGQDESDSFGNNSIIIQIGVDGAGNFTINGDAEPSPNSPLGKMLADIKEFVGMGQNKASLSDEEEKTMTNLQSADADLRSIEPIPRVKTDVLVYRRVTEKIASDPSFPFRGSNYSYYGKSRSTADSYNEGVKMGRVLAHRLKIMQDESFTVYNRQRHGKIDKRRVSGLGFGEETVFYNSKIEAIKPVMLDISIDSSGSMSGDRWYYAYAMATAMAHAASKIGKMRVRINIRTTHGGYGSNHDAVVAIIYDSARDTMIDLKKVSKHIGPTGGTPEGLCFEAILEEVLQDVKDTRRFFVNLSDGEPAAYIGRTPTGTGMSYSGIEAANHTRRIVETIRREGITVMSYFITDNGADKNRHTLFDRMYGPDARYITPTSISQIATTLNRMFVKGGRN